MSKEKAPVTQAIRLLRQHQVSYSEHLYKYEEKGGTRVSARELGVDEHCVIKTLIMEDEHKKIYINGGKRGFLLGLSPQEVIRVLQPVLVQAAAS